MKGLHAFQSASPPGCCPADTLAPLPPDCPEHRRHVSIRSRGFTSAPSLPMVSPMTLIRRTWLPLAVAALVLVPMAPAVASTTVPAKDKAVVNLTFDVLVGAAAAGELSDDTFGGNTVYKPTTF